LPTLAAERGVGVLQAWSAGCASGEEPYTLSILWELGLAARFPAVALRILATDVDETMLGRARRGRYAAGSLRELPERWRTAAFEAHEREVCLRPRFRERVSVERHDMLRDRPPGAEFDLVLCRNLAFTYFDETGQLAVAQRLGDAMRAGGALVLGRHETLPAGAVGFSPWSSAARIYRRVPAARSARAD
jgi:chemotaxis protein methyltransferase CheR